MLLGRKGRQEKKAGEGRVKKEDEQITLGEERARRTLGGRRKEKALLEVKIWIRSGTSE